MMDKEYFIKKWLESSLTEEELKTFQSFDEYEELEKLSSAVQLFKAPKFDIQNELVRLKQEKKGQGKIVRMSWLNNLVRVAAVIIMLCASFFYFYLNAETSMVADIGEKGSLFLPDSSRIDLNASSSIAFKQRLWNINRRVALDGEAFFDVAKGSKFDVYTSVGIVSVLGTEFNVKNRSEYFEVICFEGSVSVEINSNTQILKPGESISMVNSEVIKKVKLGDSKPSWLSGESSFSSVPFKEVVDELERQYGIHVSMKGVDLENLFTGKFVHHDLHLALQAVTIPFYLEYQIIDENQINLKKRED